MYGELNVDTFADCYTYGKWGRNMDISIIQFYGYIRKYWWIFNIKSWWS